MEKAPLNCDLIISLIQSDLRNSKLIYNLNNAGVFVENFYTDLCQPIFELMGFDEEERDEAFMIFTLQHLMNFAKTIWKNQPGNGIVCCFTGRKKSEGKAKNKGALIK